MKRILVIDESQAIRETLALILGREFIVSMRSFADRQFRLADAKEEIDLLILGEAPQFGAGAASLLQLTAQLPFSVLFLVDSKATARAIEEREGIGCLTKPFNPYELHAKVDQLLARQAVLSRVAALTPTEKPKDFSRYLEFPYLSRSVASLVPRFAAAGLPTLICGEIGCGQDRVARGVQTLQQNRRPIVSIEATELSADYLAQKAQQLAQYRFLNSAAPSLLIENIDKSQPASQSLLLSFLEEQEDKIGQLRYLTTATGDLLERVYRGEFNEALYHRLATLTLKLPPLRERVEDIAILASWLGRDYATVLKTSEPIFSPDALSRLKNYLWFGNLDEMDSVIARTLALHGGGNISAGDLIFDFGDDVGIAAKPFESRRSAAPINFTMDQPKLQVYNSSSTADGSANGHRSSVDLSVVIHELAHELKNPMVTIKTFAQLLGDRYQDENFRARFQEMVGGDIERMDDLLEVMLEFADFAQPKRRSVALAEIIRSVAKEIQNEMSKRQTRFEWKDNGAGSLVHADESQLTYILKNVLLAVLSEAKLGSEIGIDIAREGSIIIAYMREAARVTSITHYLSNMEAHPNEGILPLRLLLAKELIERNGGRFSMDQADPLQDTLRLEFSIG